MTGSGVLDRIVKCVCHFIVSGNIRINIALNIYTVVTSDVTLEFVENYSKDFGKDSNGNVTGLFMDSYNKDDLGTLKLKVSAMGAAVDQLATITMKFKYN